MCNVITVVCLNINAKVTFMLTHTAQTSVGHRQDPCVVWRHNIIYIVIICF